MTKFVAKLEPDVANCNTTLMLETENCADTHEFNISVFSKTNLVQIFPGKINLLTFLVNYPAPANKNFTSVPIAMPL